MKQLLFTSLLLALSAAPAIAQIGPCFRESREMFAEKNYPEAEALLESCAKQFPKNANLLISLGGVKMILNKNDEAITAFQSALRAADAKSPYRAYVNSRLGDIYMSKKDLPRAAAYYDASLKYEPANKNALVGKGITEERAGRIPSAVNFYKRALAVDFTNLVARERLIYLEPQIITDEQLLRTLKERNIIDPVSTDFTAKDKELYLKIHNAEANNALEYLSQKYENNIPPGYIVERDAGKVYVRRMLTLTGYRALVAQLSKDAQDFFLKKAMDPGIVFALRDLQGRPMFDEAGHLTDFGLAAYTKAMRGQKSYLRPGEAPPKKITEEEKLAQQYQKEGYCEISQPEFLWLMRDTRCSEDTLTKDLGARIINPTSQKKRVFLNCQPDAMMPVSLPYEKIYIYRQKNKPGAQQQPTYGSAFGLGARDEDLKLCNTNGKLLEVRDIGSKNPNK